MLPLVGHGTPVITSSNHEPKDNLLGPQGYGSNESFDAAGNAMFEASRGMGMGLIKDP
jgi:hypothetical protein